MTVELITGWDAVPVTRILGIAGLAVVLVVLWWRARTGDPLLGAGLALAATVALAPVFHPWYATWPLAVLAATLRRDTLLAGRAVRDGGRVVPAGRLQPGARDARPRGRS